jgi:hypothetical protein
MSVRGQVPYVTREMTSRRDVVTIGLPVVRPYPPPSRRGATNVGWAISSGATRVEGHMIITNCLRRKPGWPGVFLA